MSLSVQRKVFQSSDLSRLPQPVFEAAGSAPVEITRRDDESLIMMSKSESDARDSLLELAAQLIAITLEDDEVPLGTRMAERFDWMFALDPVDREKCAADLIRAARASFSTKQAHLAIAELTAWQSTAYALAAGQSNDSIQWIEKLESVEKP